MLLAEDVVVVKSFELDDGARGWEGVAWVGLNAAVDQSSLDGPLGRPSRLPTLRPSMMVRSRDRHVRTRLAVGGRGWRSADLIEVTDEEPAGETGWRETRSSSALS